MFVKRILLTALTAVCAVSLLIPTALAHGGCHGGRGGCRAAPPCTVEECTLTGWHYHDRALYCGHTHGGDGLCDGSCYALCDLEGCDVTGRHVHDGVTYCGAGHDDGYCDGSCPLYQGPAYSGSQYRGHHGCHH